MKHFLFSILLTFLNSFLFAQTGAWNRISDFDNDIWRASAFVVNDSAYLAFGFSARNGGARSSIRVYDQVNDEWILKSDFPGAGRGNVKSIPFNNEVYFFGGSDRPSSSLSEYYDDYWKYDPVLDEWDSLGVMPNGEQLSDMEGFVIGDTIYIGLSFRNSVGNFERVLYAYHPSTSEFVEKSIDFSSGKMFSYNDRGFLVSDSLYEYNQLSNTWAGMSANPNGYVSRQDRHFVIDDKIYLIRFQQDYVNNTDGEKSLISYDFITNEWTEEDFGGKLAEYGVSFVLDNKAYFGTGDTGVSGVNFISDFYEFDLTKDPLVHPNDLQVSEIGVNHMVLNWTDRSDNESAFVIERHDVGHEPFFVIDTVDANTTTFTDSLLTPNYEYKYYVRAINDENPGGVYSNMVIETTKDFPTVPDTLVVVGFSSQSTWLSWTDNSNNEDGFVIRRKTESSDFMIIDTVAANEYEYIDSGLESVSYTYQIFAINDIGSSDSTISNEITPYYNPVGGWIPVEKYPEYVFDWSVGTGAGDKAFFNSVESNQWWEYDSNTDSWSEKTSFPGEPRENAVSFSIGDTVYLGAGYVEGDEVSDFWAYSISGDSWTQIADIPQPTFDVPYAVANDKGYVLALNGQLYEYDPMMGSWVEKAELTGIFASRSASAVELDGIIYFALGSFDNFLYAYNPNSDEWTRKADFPGELRNEGVGFATEGMVYFGTGGLFFGQHPERSDFWKYDPSTDSWNRSGDLPIPTTRSVSFNINNEGYVLNGRGSLLEDNFYKYVDEIPNFATKLEAKAVQDTIKLSWIDNAANEAGFYIFRESEQEAKVCIDTLNVNTENYIDLTVEPTILYSYEIVAFNEHGEASPVTGQERTFTQEIPEPPINLRTFAQDRDRNDIYWDSGNPDSEEIYFIDVSRDHFQNTLEDYSNFEVADNYIRLENLEPETDYQIRVRSHNYFNTSENSEVFEWTTLSWTPETPNFLRVSGIDTNSATLHWNHNGPSADTFFIDVSDNLFLDTQNQFINASSTFITYNLSDLEPNTNYQIRIRASYQGYISENSDTLSFKTKTLTPDARSGAVSFVINDTPYLGLGENSDSTYSDLWMVNVSDDSYNKMATFPGVARSEAVAFVINDIAYVGSGQDNMGNVLDDFYSYDPVLNEWNQIANLDGVARRSAVSFSLAGEGYVGTGRGSSTELSDFWKYNPDSNSWIEVIGFSGDARQEAVAFVANGKGYVSGGVAYSGGTTQYSDVQEFNPTDGSWSEKIFAETDLNINQASAFVVRNIAYIAYGNQESVISYDPSTGGISDLGDYLSIDDGELGDTRADAISFVVSDTVYFGYGSSGFFTTLYYNDLNEFIIPNSAPTDIELDNLQINENEEVGSFIGNLTAIDEDNGDIHSYEFTENQSDNDFFEIEGNSLVSNAIFNFEERSLFTISIRAIDSQEESVEKTFFIEIKNVNDPPTITPLTLAIDENSVIGSLAGQIVASDVDGDHLVYSVIASSASGAFETDGNLLIVADSSLIDYELNEQITLTVRASDGEFNTEEEYVINVNNVNEAPIVNETSFNVMENSAENSLVAQLTFSDPEQDAVTVNIVSGNHDNTFKTEGHDILVNDSTILDFETLTEIELGIEVSDGEIVITELITLNIQDVNEAPSVSNFTFNVLEDAPDGTIIGDLQSNDPEGDDLSYSILTSDASTIFDVNANGEIVVVSSSSLNSEQTPTYNLEIEVSDNEFRVLYDIVINVEEPLGLVEDLSFIYPNPATDVVYFNQDQLKLNDGEIIVYSQEGKIVIHKTGIQDKLDISGLQSGVYTLVITSGGQAFSSKFKIN